MINSLGIKAKVKIKKCKKASYAIRNFSVKDPSNIIRDFEKLLDKIYESSRPKHDPTDSYFYLARQLSKCMVRADALN